VSDIKPRPGDTVAVDFKAVWLGEQDGQRIVDIADGLGPIHVQIPVWATVEVLERADDPGRDLEGVIRQEEHLSETETVPGISLWQATFTRDHRLRWLCTYSTARGNRGEYLDHEDVVGMPIIGAAPGTPAWEAERTASSKSVELPAWERELLEEEAAKKCRATEGATGIECNLQRLHRFDEDHLGVHDPANAEHEGIGYRLIVRWPWNSWDRDYAVVAQSIGGLS